ncbi:hypothetical protein V3A08_12385 [Tenacibaculum maritimum]|uniref:hypothetical protein n=1 Tax=Tenacibaculum maritimum TaxID=107401 RepID=UPI0012E538C0|nr:hypothetical protein [Tenacibaculum maritimum]CAA0258786.1 Probable lipoprotein precursor [Tenacibaculum maritimum]
MKSRLKLAVFTASMLAIVSCSNDNSFQQEEAINASNFDKVNYYSSRGVMSPLTDGEALFILKNKEALLTSQTPQSDKAADAAADIITLLKGKAKSTTVLTENQINEANNVLRKLMEANTDANATSIATEIVNNNLLRQQSNRPADMELFNVANRKFLESIYKSGIASSYQRTGVLAAQAGGATANQIEEKKQEWIENRIFFYVKGLYVEYKEDFIRNFPWADQQVTEYQFKNEFKGTEEEKEVVRLLAENDLKRYKSFLNGKSGAKRAVKLRPTLQKTKDDAKAFIQTLPRNHFLIRLAEIAIPREKYQEGAITAQYVYGGKKQNEGDIIKDYIQLVGESDAELLRFWTNSQIGWEQDLSEFRAMRRKEKVAAADIDIFIGSDKKSQTQRDDENNWKPLVAYILDKNSIQ